MFALPAHIRLDPARAAMLLRAVAADPNGPHARAFDEFFYPAMVWFSLNRARALARTMLRPTGRPETMVYVPSARTEDVDAIAHDTATRALTRARTTAALFDPVRGDAIDWVLRNAAVSYVDTVRAAYGRRGLVMEPTEEAELERIVNSHMSPPPTPEVVAMVDSCFQALTPDESRAILLRERFGYTYDEIAVTIFGTATARKRVDHLLQSARAKLRDAWCQPRA